MKTLITPRQVGRALQVSESSVKRWCDKGVIPTQYTAGGHRRIPLSGLVAFLRTTGQPLIHPEILGLPATSGRTSRVVERAAEQLTAALIQGAEEQARGIILDLFLAEQSLCVICDQVIGEAFQTIGTLWECGDAEIYQERRSCEISQRLLFELLTLTPAPPAEAPRAIGGTVEGDPYQLATTMSELILREAGWNASSLGDNLPFSTLAAAIRDNRPRIFWLSCSHLENVDRFLAGYEALYDEFGFEVAFVVGGRALSEEIRQQMKYASFCDTMQHLESFARTLDVRHQ
jgi:MerR family transcriptional regulator, light-induced transcriptional regulator